MTTELQDCDDASKVRVVLIEDQRLFMEVIGAIVEQAGMNVVATCETGADGLEATRVHEPDLVLVDMGLPDQDGLAVGTQIINSLPETRVVALSAREDPAIVREAMRAGFAGYLSKNTTTQGFVLALSAVLEGKTVFRHRVVSSQPVSRIEDRDAALLVSHLTEREREVLALVATGASGREMAQVLKVSPNTVRSHVQAVLTKLQVHSRLEAATFAMQWGLDRSTSRLPLSSQSSAG